MQLLPLILMLAKSCKYGALPLPPLLGMALSAA
jgi:hypothetical protein